MDRQELKELRKRVKGKKVTVEMTPEEAYGVTICIKIARDMQRINVVHIDPFVTNGVTKFLGNMNKCTKEQLGISEEMIKEMRRLDEEENRNMPRV